MSHQSPRNVASLTLQGLLEQSPWYAQIDAPARQQVLGDASELHVLAGHSLGHHGEIARYWHGVLEGLFKWSITSPDGREVTLGGQSAGSWFGEGTLLRALPRQADLIALRHSRVAMIPFETFDWLRQTQPSFNEFLLGQINERLHWFMGSYAAYRLLDTDGQIARALCGLVHPLLNPQGQRHLQISQEELGNLAAVSRQRCNMALVRMKNNGLIRTEYGGIVILDLAGLQKIAS